MTETFAMQNDVINSNLQLMKENSDQARQSHKETMKMLAEIQRLLMQNISGIASTLNCTDQFRPQYQVSNPNLYYSYEFEPPPHVFQSTEPSPEHQFYGSNYSAPKVFDESFERNHVFVDETNTTQAASCTSLYTLTCHTTLSTGQVYYAIESLQECSKINSASGESSFTSSLFDKTLEREVNEEEVSRESVCENDTSITYGDISTLAEMSIEVRNQLVGEKMDVDGVFARNESDKFGEVVDVVNHKKEGDITVDEVADRAVMILSSTTVVVDMGKDGVQRVSDFVDASVFEHEDREIGDRNVVTQGSEIGITVANNQKVYHSAISKSPSKQVVLNFDPGGGEFIAVSAAISRGEGINKDILKKYASTAMSDKPGSIRKFLVAKRSSKDLSPLGWVMILLVQIPDRNPITWVRSRFEDYFSNLLKLLDSTYLTDSSTSAEAPKRFHQPLQFTTSVPNYLVSVMATSILCAETFSISTHASNARDVLNHTTSMLGRIGVHVVLAAIFAATCHGIDFLYVAKFISIFDPGGGACDTIQATISRGDGNNKMEDFLLWDVTSLSLVLEIVSRVITFSILRKTTILTKKEQVISAYLDNRIGVLIHVLQGTSLKKNFKLCGTLLAPRGMLHITVFCDTDTNSSLLHTTVRCDIDVNGEKMMHHALGSCAATFWRCMNIGEADYPGALPASCLCIICTILESVKELPEYTSMYVYNQIISSGVDDDKEVVYFTVLIFSYQVDKFRLNSISSYLRVMKMSTNDSDLSIYSSKAQLLAFNVVSLPLKLIASWSDSNTTTCWKDEIRTFWGQKNEKAENYLPPLKAHLVMVVSTSGGVMSMSTRTQATYATFMWNQDLYKSLVTEEVYVQEASKTNETLLFKTLKEIEVLFLSLYKTSSLVYTKRIPDAIGDEEWQMADLTPRKALAWNLITLVFDPGGYSFYKVFSLTLSLRTRIILRGRYCHELSYKHYWARLSLDQRIELGQLHGSGLEDSVRD